MSDAGQNRSNKKRKVEKVAIMDGLMRPHMSRLTRHEIDFEPDLSPASFFSNRIAIHASKDEDALANNKHTIFMATGRSIETLTAHRPPADTFGERGKGGVFLPYISPPISTIPYENTLASMTLQSEIQSLKLSPSMSDGTAVLGCTDSYGRAVVARLSFSSSSNDNNNNDDIDNATTNTTTNNNTNSVCHIHSIHQLQPTNTLVEAGWTGIAIANDQPSQTVIARHFPKDITVFDSHMPVRTIHTMYRPYSIQLLSSSMMPGGSSNPVVVAAEGPMLSVWDIRAQGRGARVAKIPGNPFSGHIYCTAISEQGGIPLIAGGGADRSLTVWDPRKWTVLDRWSNCCKYEMTYVDFLHSNPGYCVVGGMDYEVVCGMWAGEKRKGGRMGGGGQQRNAGGDGDDDGSDDNNDALLFRGDSKWMGLTRAAGCDVVAGYTASKQLYIAEYS